MHKQLLQDLPELLRVIESSTYPHAVEWAKFTSQSLAATVGRSHSIAARNQARAQERQALVAQAVRHTIGVAPADGRGIVKVLGKRIEAAVAKGELPVSLGSSDRYPNARSPNRREICLVLTQISTSICSSPELGTQHNKAGSTYATTHPST